LASSAWLEQKEDVPIFMKEADRAISFSFKNTNFIIHTAPASDLIQILLT
jgi:hypothetical protein